MLNEVFPARWLVGIIEAVTGKLFGSGRIEREVQQIRTIAILAKHVRRHKAGAGIVAFITQNTVELQGVADGLMNLQKNIIDSVWSRYILYIGKETLGV
ncbi:hypothetical protein NKDENANG_01337 [Candidatus Entotheonellaceae bacterium PAL068K]